MPDAFNSPSAILENIAGHEREDLVLTFKRGRVAMVTQIGADFCARTTFLGRRNDGAEKTSASFAELVHWLFHAAAPAKYVLVDLRSVVGNCSSFWCAGGGYTCELNEAAVFEDAAAFALHRNRPEVDFPIPFEVARELMVQHVRRGPLVEWVRANPDPRREDPPQWRAGR